MNKISATEAKQSFGLILDNVQHYPIEIQRQGRSVAALLSWNEYLSLKGEKMTDEQALGAKSFLKKWSGKIKKEIVNDKLKSKLDPTHEDYDPRLDYLLSKHLC
jgi:prevent-host-death family protein